MDWLVHNPIADLPGPMFLILYAGLALLTCFAGFRAVRARDRTGLREPPTVPSKLDPYEVAYLRGGVNEVIRTVLYALRERGFVEIQAEAKKWYKPGTSRLGQAADRPDPGELTGLEYRVFDAVARPVQASELFQSKPMAKDVEELCAPLRTFLEEDELLRPDDVKRAGWPTWLLGAGVLVGLASYKIAVALAKGRTNIEFLVILTVLGVLFLGLTVAVATSRRTSDRGQAYLDRLRLAFADLKDPASRESGGAYAFDGASLLMVALFGLTTLKGTPDAAFADLFAQSSAGGGGCGGGCGGGGCGGGGCGGCGG